MSFQSEDSDPRTAHVIVVGNEKGGAGKSTLSIHIAVALMKSGYKVACIDLDTRQQTMTRFFENRASWSGHAGRRIELPRHCAMGRGESSDVKANEAQEFSAFARAIGEVEHDFEFVVIDTPASDSYLMRLAHSLADTLVSPLNDSYIDMDVFSRVHHDRKRRGGVAHYADLVMQARRKRRIVDSGVIDWVMVRNRMATLTSNNARQISVSIGRLSQELGFRVADGLHDRVIFRELFPIGLTALDPIEAGVNHGALTSSQISARREIEALVAALALPGIAQRESRKAWRDRVVGLYQERAQETARAAH
jgi:chromosome partitioning protein